ncbi:hypothetical protein Tco_1083045 [Tanacetum coccineum]|uniref:Uncharacterized protein n=1 Tax=Tanacetum coccineum TaxID=301880 RepID=A0ABQ5I3K7_9ASTR
MLYQNYLREFWYTDVVEDPNPLEDESKVHLLEEFIIKFSIKNGKKPLTLDFKTFCESIGLDYNKGDYVTHPSPEVVKEELGNIAINEALPLPEGKNINLKDSRSVTQLADRGQPKALVTDPSGADTKYQTSSEVELDSKPLILITVADIQALLIDSEDDLKDDSDDDVFKAGEEMDEDIQQSPSPHQEQPESSKGKKSSKYLRGITRILKNLQEVHNVVKEDPAMNKKVLKVAEAYIENPTNLTKLITLVKNFDFHGIRTIVDSLQAVSSSNYWGESLDHTTTISPTEETPSQTKGEKAKMETKEKELEVGNVEKEASRDIDEPPRNLVPASTKVCQDPDAPLEKEEKMEQATREARLCKPELIKVVHEEATKAGVDPKALSNKKGG